MNTYTSSIINTYTVINYYGYDNYVTMYAHAIMQFITSISLPGCMQA